MIKQCRREYLPSCLDVYHKGYETVANEFGLTEENCPDRGRASLPIDKLISEFENGALIYGYFAQSEMVGLISFKMKDESVCKINDVIVLPENRHNGYGKELLDFCKTEARKRGAAKVTLGMIDNNRKLRKWYEKYNFRNIGYKNFENAPFTVGCMECNL